MSWAEVMKVNSDMREPLNYVHYINDISVFGNKSFIMAKENKNLWNEFCLRSLWLYGHKQIREYVYARLDVKNVDSLWKDSGVLGEQLNAFYGVEAFPNGNGFVVMQNMTTDLFNILESKFQEGYSRYVEKFLSGEKVGQWLVSTFKLTSNVLPTLNTIEEIIANNEAVTDICSSVQALTALTSCTYSADKISAAESTSETVVQNSLNALTIHALISNRYFMRAAVQKQNVMQLIANSQAAMYSAIRSSIAMDAILNSTVAMGEIAKSAIAINTLLVAIDDLSKGTASLQTIQSNISSIRSNLPKIIEGNTAEQEVKQTEETINGILVTLNPILSKMVVVKETIAKFVNNATAMKVIANSSTAMKSIAVSSAAMTEIAASSTAMTAIANSSTARNACINSSVAMNVVSNSNLAVGKFAVGCAGLDASLYPDFNTVAASSTAMKAIANSSIAMRVISNSSVAMNVLYTKKSRLSGAKKNTNGKMIILEISPGNTHSVESYGYATLSDGSKPNWNGYISRFAYFQMFPMYATYIRNDTEFDDWVDYFLIE
ncbi:hypothetical protein [Clostridium merdae]|uniref:hypothetical protein n=1 Tax=Clostridium merdae TaxID=1958780 RepID=UPI000A271628|nr:hypothetical protein [Clostridium merdae]